MCRFLSYMSIYSINYLYVGPSIRLLIHWAWFLLINDMKKWTKNPPIWLNHWNMIMIYYEGRGGGGYDILMMVCCRLKKDFVKRGQMNFHFQQKNMNGGIPYTALGAQIHLPPPYFWFFLVFMLILGWTCPAGLG